MKQKNEIQPRGVSERAVRHGWRAPWDESPPLFPVHGAIHVFQPADRPGRESLSLRFIRAISAIGEVFPNYAAGIGVTFIALKAVDVLARVAFP
jgi:hypothetical protein